MFVRFFGEHEIIPETATLASKCLFWSCSAACAGMFVENEITPETATLAPKCLFWGYSAASVGRFGENEISPERACIVRSSTEHIHI